MYTFLIQNLAFARELKMGSEGYHVMMVPWLAFGHMLPFLELAKRLAAKGIRVSFISAPRNIKRLPPLPPLLIDKVKYVEIPLPEVNGLPQNCEATIDLQGEQIEYLKRACDGLQDPIEKLVQEDLPDIILFDFVLCWIPQIASKYDVASAFFSAYAPSTLGFLGPPDEFKSPSRWKPEDLAVPPKWFPLTSLVAQSFHQAARMFKNLNFPDVSGISSNQRWEATLEGSEFVAVRSCPEFDGEYLQLLENFYRKPVVPVGLLAPNFKENVKDVRINSNWSATSKWLERQARKSVVFVGFGTEYKMPLKQIHELAHGLQLSELPFIWILRKPEGVDSSELFPPGFLARTSHHGFISLGWAPQVKILADPAIGACLYHSGWSSIIETLGFGHPQILMPMVDDQGLNARLLVEKGVGLEVPRNEDGSFTRDEVAKSIRLVMQEKEGEPLRKKAAQMRTIFGDLDLQDSYINKLIEFLYNKKTVNCSATIGAKEA